MTKTLDFAYETTHEIKVGDDETTFTLVCKNEDLPVDLTTAKSITAKIGSRSGYLREQPISIDSLAKLPTGQLKFNFDEDTLANFPTDSYFLEIWVTDAQGTSIYPSGNPLNFIVTANIENSSGATITTISYDNFVEAMNKAASTIAKGDTGDRGPAGFDASSKNIKAFGVKGDGTTDDTNAIKQAISSASTGDTLFFPNGSYKISDNIQINKRINIQGVKPIYQSGNLVNGSVLSGGGGLFFVDGSSGSFVSGLGIVVATGFTNGFDVRGTLNGIIIRDCLTIAQAHGYLIESYNGLVSDTKVQNCEAHDSIHGFISKATRTTFSNCLAQNLSFYGFGIISDNIQSITSIGAAIDNKVVACRSVGVGLAFIQYRRNYFEDNATTVPCLGNQFLGCSNQDCKVGLVIGDALGDTGGGKYHTYPVSGTVVSNYTERGGQLRAMYTEGLSLSGLYLQSIGQVSKDSTHQNTGMVVSSRSGQALGNFDNLQLLDSGSSPSVAFGNLFRTNNSSATTITSLSDGNNGQTYTIVLWDNGTTIANNSSISLTGGDVHGYGNSVTLRCQNGVFYEMQRTKFTQKGTQLAGTSSIIDPGLNNFVDVVLSDTTTAVPISINTPEARDALLTILVRTSHGTAAQGGFDTSQFVVPSDLPTAGLDFGNGLMTVWAYLKAINKYVLVSWRMTKYA
ncbi:glycosyl hydrolase family 28-related protein [Lactiplantibacillus plantarum]|uniref:glycosyl hydrolase family 28-related protein n=1 Tax=Lactiplantibacillus plantarum TaxID=1590 RepID=UPI003F531F23